MSAATVLSDFRNADEGEERGEAGDREETESGDEVVNEESFEVPAWVESRHKYLRHKFQTIDFPAARRDPAIITDYEEGKRDLGGGLVGILLEWYVLHKNK